MVNNKGFTLIEIILVMVIIGVLGMSILPNINKSKQKALSVTNETNLRVLKSATMMYLSDNPDIESNGEIKLENLYEYVEDKENLEVPKGLIDKEGNELKNYLIKLEKGKIIINVE